jgi:hypothetical protein
MPSRKASGPLPSRVITWTTPASASEPQTAEAGPRTISTRSMLSRLSSVEKSNDPPRALAGSFRATPSISTFVWFGSKPRV